MTDPIRIVGLTAFRRSLQQLDRDTPKLLRIAFNGVADVVIEKAVPKVPRRTGAAQAALKARSTQLFARVAGGGRKAPYYPWLDFGGKVGRNKRTVRPFYTDGRYLYKTYYELRDAGKLQDIMQQALLDIVRQSGLSVD